MEEINNKGIVQKVKDFFVECVRVLRVTKKPTNDEFKTIVKVSALGMALMGLIGFSITMVMLAFRG